MKLHLDVSEVLEKLEYIVTVVEDASLSFEYRNAIFRIKDNVVSVYGYNNIITCSSKLSFASIENFETETKNPKYNPEKGVFIQVNAKKLFSILKKVQNSRKMDLLGVYFESDNRANVITLNIREVGSADKNGDNEDIVGKERLTRVIFNNIPITAESYQHITILEGINTVKLSNIVTSNIKFYLDTVGAGVDNTSEMVVGDEEIYNLTLKYAIVCANLLEPVFKNVTLLPLVIKFLNKVITGFSVADVGITPTLMYVVTDKLTSSINLRTRIKGDQHNLKIEDYKKIVAKVRRDGTIEDVTGDKNQLTKFANREIAVVVNKIDLQDVVDRIEIFEDEKCTIEMKFDEGVMSISNKYINTEVHLIQQKNTDLFRRNIFYSVPTKELKKILLGSDVNFSSEIYLFIIPNIPLDTRVEILNIADKEEKRKAKLAVYDSANDTTFMATDETSSWYSLIKVKTFARDKIKQD